MWAGGRWGPWGRASTTPPSSHCAPRTSARGATPTLWTSSKRTGGGAGLRGVGVRVVDGVAGVVVVIDVGVLVVVLVDGVVVVDGVLLYLMVLVLILLLVLFVLILVGVGFVIVVGVNVGVIVDAVDVVAF